MLHRTNDKIIKKTKVKDIDKGIFIFSCFSKVIKTNKENEIVISGIDVKNTHVQRVIKDKLDFVRVFRVNLLSIIFI